MKSRWPRSLAKDCIARTRGTKATNNQWDARGNVGDLGRFFIHKRRHRKKETHCSAFLTRELQFNAVKGAGLR